jgi:uncharacterized membrane protein
MLEQIQRESWWFGLVRALLVITATVCLTGAGIFFGLVSLYLAAGVNTSPAGVALFGLGSLVLLLAAGTLAWHVRRRNRINDLMVELMRLEMRVLELEGSQRNPSRGMPGGDPRLG